MDKEFKKWLIFGIVGLALGIYLAVALKVVLFVLLGPLYVIGLCYGAGKVFPWFLNTMGSLSKATFLAFLSSKFILGIITILLLAAAFCLMLVVGWLVGLVLAIMALVGAIQGSMGSRSSTYAGRVMRQEPDPWSEVKEPDEKPAIPENFFRKKLPERSKEESFWSKPAEKKNRLPKSNDADNAPVFKDPFS